MPSATTVASHPEPSGPAPEGPADGESGALSKAAGVETDTQMDDDEAAAVEESLAKTLDTDSANTRKRAHIETPAEGRQTRAQRRKLEMTNAGVPAHARDGVEGASSSRVPEKLTGTTSKEVEGTAKLAAEDHGEKGKPVVRKGARGRGGRGRRS